MKNWRTPKVKKLATALLSLKNEEAMLNFLRDLCTLDELNELSERWHIAQMLAKGESYRSIAAKTKVSTTTVTRIANWLHNGEGGYQVALTGGKKKTRYN